MPSHKCHEEIGILLGLDLEAVKMANLIIDFPEENLPRSLTEIEIFRIGHDDSRKWAMDVVRRYLFQLYGYDGILAADLHYALDYVERWLDPKKAKKMLEAIEAETLYPFNRRGFADPFRRLWYPSYIGASGRLLPITAYCKKCKGKLKLINSPFCNECQVNILTLPELKEIPIKFIILMFRKHTEKRELHPKIVSFIEENISVILNKLIKDREERNLQSLKIVGDP